MSLRKVTVTLLVLFGFLIAYSDFNAALNYPSPPFMTPLITLTGFAFALTHASERMGWKNALILLASVFAVSLLFESLGVATGLVYGPYHYTDQLGPKFLGLVPYLIAIAWFMMMYPSFVLADWLVPTRWTGWKHLLAQGALGGAIMTAWDVVMDPMMVARGNWVWDVNGAYFGVPLQNFWGWWLTVFTTFVLFLLIIRNKSAKMDAPFDRLTLVAYMFVGYGNTVSALLLGLGGPALAGIFALTPWVAMGWARLSEQ